MGCRGGWGGGDARGVGVELAMSFSGHPSRNQRKEIQIPVSQAFVWSMKTGTRSTFDALLHLEYREDHVGGAAVRTESSEMLVMRRLRMIRAKTFPGMDWIAALYNDTLRKIIALSCVQSVREISF